MTYTKSNVEGAFKRLHRAMGWPTGPTYKDGKPVVGAIFLQQAPHGGYRIVQMCNEGGGELDLHHVGSTRREAFEAMANMASAVDMYKANLPR